MLGAGTWAANFSNLQDRQQVVGNISRNEASGLPQYAQWIILLLLAACCVGLFYMVARANSRTNDTWNRVNSTNNALNSVVLADQDQTQIITSQSVVSQTTPIRLDDLDDSVTNWFQDQSQGIALDILGDEIGRAHV